MTSLRSRAYRQRLAADAQVERAAPVCTKNTS
jgi:hypothetical protein